MPEAPPPPPPSPPHEPPAPPSPETPPPPSLLPAPQPQPPAPPAYPEIPVATNSPSTTVLRFIMATEEQIADQTNNLGANAGGGANAYQEFLQEQLNACQELLQRQIDHFKLHPSITITNVQEFLIAARHRSANARLYSHHSTPADHLAYIHDHLLNNNTGPLTHLAEGQSGRAADFHARSMKDLRPTPGAA